MNLMIDKDLANQLQTEIENLDKSVQGGASFWIGYQLHNTWPKFKWLRNYKARRILESLRRARMNLK